ncbi:MAG: Triose-phosphate isomerase [Pseudomonadota bacterium]|jgi:triosephosphate isomerase
MRPLTVIGNWKMNGSLTANQQLIQSMLSLGLSDAANNARLALCVPYPYLIQLGDLLANSGVALGAQDVSDHPNGAYTGDVSANMLQELGCQYVIVGHSERRQYHHEDDGLVARKAKAALQVNMTPIICVGETEEEHDDGKTLVVVRRQLQAVLDLLQGQVASCLLAYEPVWAIGTGKVPTPAQAQDVHRELRLQLAKFDAEAASKVAILYGGSLKPDNAKDLLAMPDIDGGLVGGASLNAQDFLALCQVSN